MEFTIYSVGNIEFLYQILNSVAMICGTGDFAKLVSIGFLLGILYIGFQTIYQGGQRINIAQTLTCFIIYLCMFGPSCTVVLEDVYEGRNRVVDNVPLGGERLPETALLHRTAGRHGHCRISKARHEGDGCDSCRAAGSANAALVRKTRLALQSGFFSGVTWTKAFAFSDKSLFLRETFMRNVPPPARFISSELPHKLTYLAAIAALLVGSASAEPYTGTSLVINAEQVVSYDSVSVNWTAGNEDEAGVLLDTGSSLTVSGDFNLISQSGAAPSVPTQQGLLVKENASFTQTDENFTLTFTADSTSETPMGAAYFEAGSTTKLGANATITSSGTAQSLWGVRQYGDLKGESLTITITNNKTAQDTQSEQGFAVGIWSESSSDLTFSKLDITADGAGNRTDGMMIYGTAETTGGIGSIDQLTVSSHNSGENGRAFGINFYQYQDSNQPVNYTLRGQTLKLTTISDQGSATGIVSLYDDTQDTSLEINYGTLDLSVQGNISARGIDLAGNPVDNPDAAVSITASDLLKVNVQSMTDQAYGIAADTTSFTTGMLDIKATAESDAYAINLVNSSWTTSGSAIVSATSDTGGARGLDITNANGEKVHFGNSLTISAEAQGNAFGIRLREGTFNVDGAANIHATSTTNEAYGIAAIPGSSTDTSSFIFNSALNVSVHGKDESTAALKAENNQAEITALHGGTISSNHLAVHANRGAQISLSSDETSTLNIQGDIKAERWSSAYSSVKLSLGNGSTWVGTALADAGATIAATLKEGSSWLGDASETRTTGSRNGKVNVRLQGGSWTLAGNQASSSSLVLSEGGTIDISNLTTDTTLTIANLQTASGETAFYTDTLHNGSVATVTTRTGTDGQVGVVASAALNESISDKTALVTELAKEVSITDGLDFIRAEGGLVSGEVVATFDPEGNMVVRTSESDNTVDLRSALALRTRLLQQQSSGLPDRLQLIRDGGKGTLGGWASISGQELRYDGTGTHSQDTSIEVGFDTSFNDWVFGGSFTYVDSDINDLDTANAEGDTYVFSLYGQRNFESGAYIGAAARYIRAETDYQLGAFDVDWKQNGWGLALESGHRFALGSLAFVEPKVAMSYAHFDSDSFTSQNVEGDLDSFDALIGSVGLRAGFSFPENRGAIYAKASANHDFKGEADGRIRSLTGTTHSDIGEDLGDTWVEYGVGGSFHITPNWNAAVDLSRTSGGEVESNWIANISMRYVW